MTDDIEHLASSIKQSLPPELENQAIILAQEIVNTRSLQNTGEHRSRTQIDVSSELIQALQELAGKQLETPNTSISFGTGSQMGDITIRDTAGRDIFNITIVSPPLDRPLPSNSHKTHVVVTVLVILAILSLIPIYENLG